jgi:Holliday junction resolvase RusA-like endonuclease
MTAEGLLPDDLSFAATGLYVAQRPQYLIQFAAYGDPAPQGSKTLVRHDRNGNLLARPHMVESADMSGDGRNKAVKEFRESIGWFAQAALKKLPTAQRQVFPLDGPLVAAMMFTVKRSTNSQRADAPQTRPDLSKYLRAAEDALKGIVWSDDGRVVGYDMVWKVYPGRHPWALDRPGVTIAVRRPTHEELALPRDSFQGLKYTRLLEKWGA